MDYGHKWTDKELKKLEKRISAEYTKAAAEMQKKVEKYYADFARKDEIKRKEVSEGKISQSEYTNWRRNQMLVGKRWEEMQANLAQDMHTVNMKTASMTRQFSYDAYAMNFNYGTFEAESGSGIDTAFTLYDRSTVERLIRDDPDMLPPPGKKVSQRIREGKDVLWNKQVIQSVMTQSILQGESIPNIATRLAEAVGDTNRKAAIRNARTMTTGAENAGREDSYKRAESMGIKMQQMWIATLDGRTRHEHRQLDGQKRKVGEPFEVSGQKIMFPGDPKAAPYLVWNCRCTLIGIVANSDVEYYKERMDERATIKGYPGMTYEEWKNEHSNKKPVADEMQNANWIDRIKGISNRSAIAEADIMEAGKIVAQEIQPIKDEYINSTSALNQQRNESYNIYNETTKQMNRIIDARIPIKESLSDLSGNLLDVNYSDLPLYKKMVFEKNLKRFGLDISINDTDKPNDILKKLDDMLNDTTNKRSKAIKDFTDATNQLDGRWMGYANKLKAKLTEIRPMGIGSTDIKSHLAGNKEMKQVIAKAYDYYPTDWVKKSADTGKITAKKAQRGFYRDWEGVIAISGDAGAQSTETAIHELGHRFERTQSLLQYETEFYNRRTAGEQLQWLGGNYRRDEKARKDDFVNAYMGKDYGGSAYELCSMGFEYAYAQPEELAKDPDMEAWIFGLLAIG